MVYNELSLCHVPVDANGDFDSAKALEAIDWRIFTMQTKVHNHIYKLINSEQKDTIKMHLFKVVKKLSAGDSFGELAL